MLMVLQVHRRTTSLALFKKVVLHKVHISALRAKLRRPNEDLHQLRCDISRLVELAYPDDPPGILNRTARDFFVCFDPYYIAREGVGFGAQYFG